MTEALDQCWCGVVWPGYVHMEEILTKLSSTGFCDGPCHGPGGLQHLSGAFLILMPICRIMKIKENTKRCFIDNIFYAVHFKNCIKYLVSIAMRGGGKLYN